MQLLFKQRAFSWFDSYDIYDEAGRTVFVVRGRMSWGHILEIYDGMGNHLGTMKRELLRLRQTYVMYFGTEPVGRITKELTFFRPQYVLDCGGWRVKGDLMGWNYVVEDAHGNYVMSAGKQHMNWTDTYVIDVAYEKDALTALMIVLAIDAAKSSD